MLTIKRTTSDNPDFALLISQLDKMLGDLFGSKMKFFGQFNSVAGSDTVLLIYDGEKAVGCGCLRKVDDSTAEIKRMFVVPAERKKGIATMILAGLEEWARELGFREVILETGNKLTDAVRLYQRNKYAITANYGPYVGVESSICMRKILTQ